jgi:hypothetical protein
LRRSSPPHPPIQPLFPQGYRYRLTRPQEPGSPYLIIGASGNFTAHRNDLVSVPVTVPSASGTWLLSVRGRRGCGGGGPRPRPGPRACITMPPASGTRARRTLASCRFIWLPPQPPQCPCPRCRRPRPRCQGGGRARHRPIRLGHLAVVGERQGTSGRLWEFLPDRTWAEIWSGLRPDMVAGMSGLTEFFSETAREH